MQNPEFDLRQVSTANEDKFFLDLAAPFLCDNKDYISTYRLKHVIPSGEGVAYAIYEEDHSVIPVQFYLGDEVIVFNDVESTQIMSLDEIRLIREIGEVSIGETIYSIKNTAYSLTKCTVGYQRMIVFNLENNEKEKTE